MLVCGPSAPGPSLTRGGTPDIWLSEVSFQVRAKVGIPTTIFEPGVPFSSQYLQEEFILYGYFWPAFHDRRLL